MEPKFKIGDRVHFTNVFGYTWIYLVKDISRRFNGDWTYSVVIPTKKGKIPLRGGLTTSCIYEHELKAVTD